MFFFPVSTIASLSRPIAPASQALGSVALGTVERISSILIHFAWGYLCFMAAYFHKKRLFLIVLPMGIVDFLVPLAQSWGIPVFEAVVFALSALSVFLAWYATRQFRKNTKTKQAYLKVNA
jgi:membrane protein implicated in regulation of membrane protease activity